MSSLKRFTQDVHDWSFDCFEASHLGEGFQDRLEVIVDQFLGHGETLDEKVDDSFEGQFLGAKQVEEYVHAAALVEVSNLGRKFMRYWKVR